VTPKGLQSLAAAPLRRRCAADAPHLKKLAGVVARCKLMTSAQDRRHLPAPLHASSYPTPGKGGRGHGARLYGAWLAQLRVAGYHAAIGGIALLDPPNIALHEKVGMRQVAHLTEVGFKSGRWLDVGYWEALL
jgi:phosphinothricin acetyltransferase